MASGPEMDPLVQQALNDRLMTDPDLAFQNEGNAALTIGYDHSLPRIENGPEITALTRDETRMALLDGGEIAELPASISEPEIASYTEDLSAEERARMAGVAEACAQGLEHSTIWAARLQDYAEIVPRGAVVDAAGSDRAGCKLRIVTYRTPLAIEDVMQFNFTLAVRAGFDPEYLAGSGPERAIRGRKGGKNLAVYVRPGFDGLTDVDIVSAERD
ncbi:hypothetical protein [Altererythrobacter sp.]|uniref:hypothetical protein n=1 Tax=Altererythrobacter sp. TaxID=1872480 RepID=UPI003CFCFECF